MLSKNQTPLVIAIVGVGRSGTSCTAGIVHKLGISMGPRLIRRKPANPKGYFESKSLQRICVSCYRYKTYCNQPDGKIPFRAKNTYRKRVALLRKWALHRNKENIIGAKHPLLCIMIPEMKAAWPNLKIIAVNRDITNVLSSCKRLGWFRYLSATDRQDMLHKMIQIRDDAIDFYKIPTLNLSFDSIVENPTSTISIIVDFLNLSPTDEQIRRATHHITPKLRHFQRTK
jgi:hypothetical protein